MGGEKGNDAGAKPKSHSSSSSSSSSSSAARPLPCSIPGRKAWELWRTRFVLDERYVPIKAIGKGAYGVVASARDEVTGERVAVKKIAGAFDNPTDARRALREIALLRALGPHDNVVAVRDVLWPPEADEWLWSRQQQQKQQEQQQEGGEGGGKQAEEQGALPPPPPPRFDDVYVLYELMDTDLHQIIRSKQPLTDEHAQFFLYQLLRGLRYVHSGGVLHRDLKPSNLLVDASCDLKIADFGLARAVGAMVARNRRRNGEGGEGEGEEGGEQEDESDGESGRRRHTKGASSSSPCRTPSSSSNDDGDGNATTSNLPARPFLTEYVVTRWYRAPELLLGASDGTREGYGAAVDVWAAGCILAELLGRSPLFAGRDYIDQLQRIVALLGHRRTGGKKEEEKEETRGKEGRRKDNGDPSGGSEEEEGSGGEDADVSLRWVPEGRARSYVAALPRPDAPPDWHRLYPSASRGSLDLLARMLSLDPSERVSVDDALRHEWLLPLADPDGEPVVADGGEAVAALGEDAGCGGGGERAVRGGRGRRRGGDEKEKKKKENDDDDDDDSCSSSSSSSSDDDDEEEEERNAGERLRLEALLEMMHYPSAKVHSERLREGWEGRRGGDGGGGGGEAAAAAAAAAKRGIEPPLSSSVEKAASAAVAAVSLSSDASSNGGKA